MDQEERVVSFFRFEDLRVYGKATDYASWVATQMSAAQSESERSLAQSMCRSAFDIAINIAEGSSRSKNQFDHYLKIAKTAIRECVVFSEVACNIGLMNEEQRTQSREYLMELTRMLGALIISLQRTEERRAQRLEDESRMESNDTFANEEMSY